MNIERLKKEKRQESRTLYEEVFPEDSRKFVDYYYRQKVSSNEIFVIKEEEKVCSMIHLNPYLLWEDGEEEKGAYLVAVATKKEFRHRGLMTSLLKEAFTFLYQKKYPFLYLMPASEAIYLPFDFRVFYWQNQCMLGGNQTELPVQSAEQKESKESEKRKTKFLDQGSKRAGYYIFV